MRQVGLIFWLALLAGGCALPVADFVSTDVLQQTAPVSLSLSNTSKNADSYIWKVNGQQVSDEKDLDHLLLESGKYQVELLASKNGKTEIKKQEFIVEPSTTCLVQMKTTAGDLIFNLLEETTLHLNNFSERLEANYYPGLIFHRVIDGFMIQTGDNNTRSGGRRYEEPPEVPAEIMTEFPHYRGAIAAARMPDDINPLKASSGSQFYIVDGQDYDMEKMRDIQQQKYFDYTDDQLEAYVERGGSAQLDGEYTVFGYLVSGFEILDKIASVSTDKYDRPVTEIKIIDIKFLN